METVELVFSHLSIHLRLQGPPSLEQLPKVPAKHSSPVSDSSTLFVAPIRELEVPIRVVVAEPWLQRTIAPCDT